MRRLRVALTDLADRARQEMVRAAVVAPLADEFPHVQWGFDPDRSAGRNYYSGFCFAIYATDLSDVEHFLVDGGFTSWTQQLLNNQKERLLISGIGTERFCNVFHKEQQS